MPGSSASATCSTSSSPEPPTERKDPDVIIKVLGPGCANCVTLERVTREAVEALGLDARIEKVTD
ncbi:thioredoxin family protein, partial [Streptomyces sp. GC420]|uniref:thioredoxin family protein n=1 Tax=Streptomyces sp. GC420 TaxID=2697568 RepID=UPI0037D9EF57